MLKIILYIFLLAVIAPYGGWAAEKTPSRDKTTWKENGAFAVSFATAKNRVRAKMAAAGYHEKHEIKMGQKDDRVLILWEKGDRKIIYMLWKIDVDKTGYSWGEWDGGKSK